MKNSVKLLNQITTLTGFYRDCRSIPEQIGFKMKTKWEGRFFSKNIQGYRAMQFQILSRMVIFDCPAPFGGELWRFENLKFVQQLHATQKFGDFVSLDFYRKNRPSHFVFILPISKPKTLKKCALSPNCVWEQNALFQGFFLNLIISCLKY